ncbi:WD40 repeat domain-containing protein [Planctomyces sp. SH-PL14]|uniref:WD40 repeat domain-containing protein n=1 Tax=Planctomyces sp. SH-PL14 TaxID=1632864 RepID=UPI00078C0367|nr:WD40 repeat domain-containing protein [Planctomyces sp. SH-PL14]AMV18979.1 WD domain, G-beta repeat [Planctomyces sp. SH-PL14]
MLDVKQAHVATQFGHDRPMIACRFDPLGRYVFAGAQDHNLIRFTLGEADGKKQLFAGAHESWVMAIAFSKDGGQVISGGGDGRIVWWETAATGTEAAAPKPLRTVEAHKGWIRALAVSPDGQFLATGGNDLVVRSWKMADGTLVRELPGHEKHVYSLEFHPGGQFLLSADLACYVKQWDLATGQAARTFDGKTLRYYDAGFLADYGGIRGMAVSGNSEFLVACGLHKCTNAFAGVNEPHAMLFRWDNQEVVRSFIADGIPNGLLWRIRFLSDGTAMAVSGGASGGHLLFWKADADKDFHRLGLPGLARDLDLHPDGLQVATAHFDHQIRIVKLIAKAPA